MDSAVLLYEPRQPFSWFPNLGWHFWTLKYGVVFFAVLSAFNCRLGTVFFALTFLLFNYYVKSFSTTWWITNTHLNFFALALCFVPNQRHARSAELASFLISFMTLYVSILYFQAGLSKVIHGGFSWFFTGDRILTETLLLGTPLGKWLTQWPWIFSFLSFGTGVFELLLPPLFLFRSTQRQMAMIAFAFHMGTFMIMGISFWFLWALYPALFSRPVEDRAESNSFLHLVFFNVGGLKKLPNFQLFFS